MRSWLVVGLLLCSALVETQAADTTALTKQRADEFTSIFHDAGPGHTIVSDEVLSFVQNCCLPHREAIQLLEDSGFEVKQAWDPEVVKDLNRKWRFKNEKYDGFISGTRRPGFARFWRITTTYRVSLFVRNGEIQGAYGVVDTAYP